MKCSTKLPQKKKRSNHAALVDMARVTAVVLGGGEGKRLFPLTSVRCKPAITFGGRYRLIDVPVSNAINAGIYKIFVLTQFLSSSIHRHISETYHLNEFTSGFLDILPAEQKPGKKEWFQGTADAVRQHLDALHAVSSDYYLILAGDQLYHLDFRKMVLEAERTGKDVIVAALPVGMHEAHRMGIMKVDEEKHIVDFVEKPSDLQLLKGYLQKESGSDLPYCLASMGIYLFKRKALLKLLEEEKGNDFGMHLIPHMVKEGRAAAYIHDGYWEDIGTIASFYKANLDLIHKERGFDLHEELSPIFSSRLHLPGAQFDQAEIVRSIVCEGSILHRCKLVDSLLGPRTVVGAGTEIYQSYIMGNDSYLEPGDDDDLPFEIGRDCIIEKAILDKNVRLGNGVKLTNEKGLQEFDSPHLYVRDGIIVVTKGAHLPDGFCF